MPLFESNTIAFSDELIKLKTASVGTEKKGFVYDGKGQWLVDKQNSDVIVGDTMTPFRRQDFRVLAHVHGVSGSAVTGDLENVDTGTVQIKVYTGDTTGAINTVLLDRTFQIKDLKAGTRIINYQIDESAGRYVQVSYKVATAVAKKDTSLRIEIVPGYIV